MDCGVILVQRFHLIIYFQMNSAEQRGKGVSYRAQRRDVSVDEHGGPIHIEITRLRHHKDFLSRLQI